MIQWKFTITVTHFISYINFIAFLFIYDRIGLGIKLVVLQNHPIVTTALIVTRGFLFRKGFDAAHVARSNIVLRNV